MCKTPVTFCGGIRMQDDGFAGSITLSKQLCDNHSPYHLSSMSFGELVFANSLILSRHGVHLFAKVEHKKAALVIFHSDECGKIFANAT